MSWSIFRLIFSLPFLERQRHRGLSAALSKEVLECVKVKFTRVSASSAPHHSQIGP